MKSYASWSYADWRKNRKMFGQDVLMLRKFFMNWKNFALEIIRSEPSNIENKYFRETQTTEFNRADCGAATACWCEKTPLEI